MQKSGMEEVISEQPQVSPYDTLSLEALGVCLFTGEVNMESARYASEFILKSNLLQTHLQNLTFFINSEGGSTSDGFAVIDLMETSRIPISTVGIGQIASMGVLLLSAGTPGYRVLTKNAEVMAHQFSGYFAGKHHELLAQQQSYEMLEKRFMKHFLRHTNMNERQIRDIVFAKTDRYLTPEECKRFGIVDRVVDYAEPVTRVKKAPAKKKAATKPSRRPASKTD